MGGWSVTNSEEGVLIADSHRLARGGMMALVSSELGMKDVFGVDEPTVHIGIVSALRRQFGRALQIDAYTSPANYGGPVVDIEGRVLGIAVPLSPAGRDAERIALAHSGETL